MNLGKKKSNMEPANWDEFEHIDQMITLTMITIQCKLVNIITEKCFHLGNGIKLIQIDNSQIILFICNQGYFLIGIVHSSFSLSQSDYFNWLFGKNKTINALLLLSILCLWLNSS
jgi:hypothetical protein